MGLLRALNLEPLPKDLADVSAKIGEVEKNLAKQDATLAQELHLKDSARKVAKNLHKMADHVEPALLEAKRDEMASLAQRISGRDANDAGLVVDAKELEMLHAETRHALKDTQENHDLLTQARKSFGDALVAHVDTGGDLAKALKGYIDGHIANKDDNQVTAAMKGLDALKNHDDKRLTKAAADVAQQYAKESLAQQKAVGPSMAAREGSRMPNDVLVHLMTVVDDTLKNHDHAPELRKVAEDGRKMFMSHEANTSDVKGLIGDARKALATLNEQGAREACMQLRGQLPLEGESLPVGRELLNSEKAHATQLHDNIYGRVFDTKMISELVKNPPAELLTASGRSGAAFAATLDDNNPKHQEAAKYFIEHYVVEDRRPWSASVPAFDEMAKHAHDGPEALKAVKEFMQKTPETGHEIVAMSYMLAKVPQAEKSVGIEPKWLTEASNNYGRITKEANRDRGASADKVVSQAAGITLLHQPEASNAPNLVPSERPGTANRMGNRNHRDNQGKELSEVARSTQNDTQLNHALPFASGVSGTTNLLIHLYDNMEKETAKLNNTGTGVTPPEFLVNSMMFLVHDGGHSMHEAMWTANQIHTELPDKVNFNVGLNDPNKANEVNKFVSNYDRLVDQFPDGSLKTSMQAAQSEAWKGTQDYLKQNSVFAQPDHPQAVVVNRMAPALEVAHQPQTAHTRIQR
jgi:hypothetical protein